MSGLECAQKLLQPLFHMLAALLAASLTNDTVQTCHKMLQTLPNRPA